jgi:hypothetical protein
MLEQQWVSERCHLGNSKSSAQLKDLQAITSGFCLAHLALSPLNIDFLGKIIKSSILE